jgi:hypothetical protein
MRAIFFAALVGLGISLVGASPSLAAPVNGSALANAANLNQAVDQVYWPATTIGTGGGGTTGITAGGNDHRAAGRATNGPGPFASFDGRRASCASAAMKLARASAKLSPRGSST